MSSPSAWALRLANENLCRVMVPYLPGVLVVETVASLLDRVAAEAEERGFRAGFANERGHGTTQVDAALACYRAEREKGGE